MRTIPWLLSLLAVAASACVSVLPAAPTLVPTAAPPARPADLAQNPAGATGSVPPTWTLTPTATSTATPARPSPTFTPYRRTVTPTVPTWTPSVTPTPTGTPTLTPSVTIAPEEPWPLDYYPRPPHDNGWGMHWFSTFEQEPAIVDRFVRELQRMHIRWLVILNDGTDAEQNDYLVRRLVRAGIMPVMRFYVHGVVPYDGNLGAAVRHYHDLGVHYFQLYNEPNLFAEAAGRTPSPEWYVTHWAQAAQEVLDNGGLPGFGALSPAGEYGDLRYLRAALRSLKRRRQEHLLNRGWLSIHNYAMYQPVDSTEGFMRFRTYNRVVVEELGHSIPILGTEGGHYGDEGEQFAHVSAEYHYLAGREDYFFCHTYWLLGNQIGGSWDASFEYQVLFRADGYVNPLVPGLFYRGPSEATGSAGEAR